MAKGKRYLLGSFMKEFSKEAKCREYLARLWWPMGLSARNPAAVTLMCCPMTGINAHSDATRLQ